MDSLHHQKMKIGSFFLPVFGQKREKDGGMWREAVGGVRALCLKRCFCFFLDFASAIVENKSCCNEGKV
jgi:hypothetical protein